VSRSPDSLSILRDLISFPTVSSESNIALIDYVCEFLADIGVQAKTILSEDGGKANLYATIGPADRPGVLLSGHTDVVPTTGQDWKEDPFVMRVADGRAIGRGTADMKGFLACVLRAVTEPLIQRLQRPVHIAFSHDEEIGCVGVRRMLPEIARLACLPSTCIIGEPTGMSLVTAHKGKTMGSVRCHGVAGHSSDPDRGANAIMMASDVVQEFGKLQAVLRQSDSRDAEFAVPFSTLHIGRIDGGTILNVIPATCRFDFEIRNIPEDDPEQILQRLRATSQQVAERYSSAYGTVSVDIDVSNSYPALEAGRGESHADLDGLVTRARPSKVSFGTEAGLFAGELGVPAVVCGPGSVEQAHRPEEYIELAQLDACDAFLSRLIHRLAERV
jgi:acetylornithine deacetylase